MIEASSTMIIRKNQSELVASVVDVLERHLLQYLRDKHVKPLGLATGRTMKPIYSCLVNRLSHWSNADLQKLRTCWLSFNLDEYVGLGEGDAESFRSYMTRHLGDPLYLSPLQLRIPDGRANDLCGEASSYGKELERLGGIGLQLLGLGNNGHIGFNEPPCGPESSCRIISLSDSTRAQNAFSFQEDLDNVPKQAITLGIQEILNADEVHLIVTGSEKKDILQKLMGCSPSEHLPASWLLKHPNFYIWADSDAIPPKHPINELI